MKAVMTENAIAKEIDDAAFRIHATLGRPPAVDPGGAWTCID
jgi:hypothetical protein